MGVPQQRMIGLSFHLSGMGGLPGEWTIRRSRSWQREAGKYSQQRKGLGKGPWCFGDAEQSQCEQKAEKEAGKLTEIKLEKLPGLGPCCPSQAWSRVCFGI